MNLERFAQVLDVYTSFPTKAQFTSALVVLSFFCIVPISVVATIIFVIKKIKKKKQENQSDNKNE